MDNKLLENCIGDVLKEANESGKDIMRMAHDLTLFHELITADKRMFAGYKIYSQVSSAYYGKLKEVGIVDKEDDDI